MRLAVIEPTVICRAEKTCLAEKVTVQHCVKPDAVAEFARPIVDSQSSLSCPACGKSAKTCSISEMYSGNDKIIRRFQCTTSACGFSVSLVNTAVVGRLPEEYRCLAVPAVRHTNVNWGEAIRDHQPFILHIASESGGTTTQHRRLRVHRTKTCCGSKCRTSKAKVIVGMCFARKNDAQSHDSTSVVQSIPENPSGSGRYFCETCFRMTIPPADRGEFCVIADETDYTVEERLHACPRCHSPNISMPEHIYGNERNRAEIMNGSVCPLVCESCNNDATKILSHAVVRAQEPWWMGPIFFGKTGITANVPASFLGIQHRLERRRETPNRCIV